MVSVVVLGGVGVHADLAHEVFHAGKFLFGAQIGHQVEHQVLPVDIFAKVEKVGLDSHLVGPGRRGLHSDIHHGAANAAIRKPRGCHVHAGFRQELVLFHLQVRGREPDGMPEAFAHDYGTGEAVGAPEVSLRAGNVAVQ